MAAESLPILRQNTVDVVETCGDHEFWDTLGLVRHPHPLSLFPLAHQLRRRKKGHNDATKLLTQLSPLCLCVCVQICGVLAPLKTAHSLLESDCVSLGDVVDCFSQLLRHVSNMEVEEGVREGMEKAIEVSTHPTPLPL